ncbi:unnamed protein product, partial [Protopolystoma xenopodis]
TACSIDSHTYFATPFTAIASARQLSQFVVIDIERDQINHDVQKSKTNNSAREMQAKKNNQPQHHISQRFLTVSVWVMRTNPLHQASFDETTMHTRTHLGHILHEGDIALG